MARQLDGIAKRMAACEKRLREALTQRWAVSGRVEHTLQGCVPRPCMTVPRACSHRPFVPVRLGAYLRAFLQLHQDPQGVCGAAQACDAAVCVGGCVQVPEGAGP